MKFYDEIPKISKEQEELFKAVKAKDVQKVKKLLEEDLGDLNFHEIILNAIGRQELCGPLHLAV